MSESKHGFADPLLAAGVDAIFEGRGDQRVEAVHDLDAGVAG